MPAPSHSGLGADPRSLPGFSRLRGRDRTSRLFHDRSAKIERSALLVTRPFARPRANGRLSGQALTDAVRATLWGLFVAGLVIAGICAGSRGLKDFDTALVSYAGASVFAAFGIGYRYAMWLRRPPTRLYWRRGWQLFVSPRRLPGNLLRLGGLVWRNIFVQTFVGRRSFLRWAGHMLIFWGVLLAAAITFPLSFGWIRFETPLDSQETYIVHVFGLRVFEFPLETLTAELIFNALVIASVLVLGGVFLALWRRARPGRTRGRTVRR